MMNETKLNGIGLNVVHLNCVRMNGGKAGNGAPPTTDKWFQFDVTPLDSGYMLIS